MLSNHKLRSHAGINRCLLTVRSRDRNKGSRIKICVIQSGRYVEGGRSMEGWNRHKRNRGESWCKSSGEQNDNEREFSCIHLWVYSWAVEDGTNTMTRQYTELASKASRVCFRKTCLASNVTFPSLRLHCLISATRHALRQTGHSALQKIYQIQGWRSSIKNSHLIFIEDIMHPLQKACLKKLTCYNHVLITEVKNIYHPQGVCIGSEKSSRQILHSSSGALNVISCAIYEALLSGAPYTNRKHQLGHHKSVNVSRFECRSICNLVQTELVAQAVIYPLTPNSIQSLQR